MIHPIASRLTIKDCRYFAPHYNYEYILAIPIEPLSETKCSDRKCLSSGVVIQNWRRYTFYSVLIALSGPSFGTIKVIGLKLVARKWRPVHWKTAEKNNSTASVIEYFSTRNNWLPNINDYVSGARCWLLLNTQKILYMLISVSLLHWPWLNNEHVSSWSIFFIHLSHLTVSNYWNEM